MSLLCLNVFSQDIKSAKNFYVEPSVNYGRLLGTTNDYNFLVGYSMYNVSCSFGLQTTGKNDWEKYFNCPDYGIALKYAFSDFEPIGSHIALIGYINGRIYQHNKFGLTYKLGFGLSLWSKIYDRVYNPENIYISTLLNCHIQLELGSYYKIARDADLTYAFVLSHSSNGAVQVPNRGVNAISFQIGYKYYLSGRQEINKDFDYYEKPLFYPKNSFYVNEGPGVLSSYTGGIYSTHFANTLQIGYARQFSPKFRYGAGFDLMYSSELPYALPEGSRSWHKGLNYAAYGSFDILYNKVMVQLAVATYLYIDNDIFKSMKFTPFYERVGVKYRFGKGLNQSAGVCMKVHFGSIDYIEWTYGVQLFNWYDKKAKK